MPPVLPDGLGAGQLAGQLGGCLTIPLVAFVQSFSQALPVVAVLAVWGRNAPAPHRRLIVWCLALVAADMVDLAVALKLGYNTFTPYFILPVEVALTLWVLSAWHEREQFRRAYLTAVGVMGVATAFLLVLTEPSRTFGLWIAPALALLSLTAVLHTLITRTLASTDLLARQDWFWICLGMGLFWIGFVPVPPFVQAFLTTQLEWVRSTYISRAWLNIAATIFMTWGVVCPRVLTRSLSRS